MSKKQRNVTVEGPASIASYRPTEDAKLESDRQKPAAPAAALRKVARFAGFGAHIIRVSDKKRTLAVFENGVYSTPDMAVAEKMEQIGKWERIE